MENNSFKSTRFDYVRYDDDALQKQAQFKGMMIAFEQTVEAMLENSRAKELVLTKLEETYMWIGKAIRDEQVKLRTAELQEARSNV